MYAELKAKGVQFKSAPQEVPAGPNKGTLGGFLEREKI
jgi:hypothetical protein